MSHVSRTYVCWRVRHGPSKTVREGKKIELLTKEHLCNGVGVLRCGSQDFKVRRFKISQEARQTKVCVRSVARHLGVFSLKD